MEPTLVMSDAESGRMLQGALGAPTRGAVWRRRAAFLAGALAVAACAAAATSSLATRSKSPLARSAVRGVTELAQSSNKTSPKASPSAIHRKGWPCEENEDIFFGDCMVDCAHATNGTYPFRHESCTCCKDEVATVGRCLDDCAKLDVGAGGKPVHKPFLEECPYDTEELFDGLCYLKCQLLTKGKYPIRTGMNTCSTDKYGGNWTMGFGPCNGFGVGATKCAPHIPVADGMGFESPMEGHVGEAPIGWTMFDPPVPNAAKQVAAEALPAAQKVAAEALPK